MDIEKIEMPIEQAKEEYKKYQELIKNRYDKRMEDLGKCLLQLKKGHKLININEVMENAGLNKTYQPKLAIARADWPNVIFIKYDEGRGVFSPRGDGWQPRDKFGSDKIWIDKNTFMTWQRISDKDGKSTWQIANKELKTKVPVIPVDLMPESDLSNFYILWEVKEWEDLPEKKDPLLLKRITENMFAIIGAWEITALEQSILDK